MIDGAHGSKTPRALSRHSLYHVFSRGNQRQRVFKDDPDQRCFESLLSVTAKGHSLTLYAYVLVPIHFHLLIEVFRPPLSKAMQPLLYCYTHYYNRRYRKTAICLRGGTGRSCAFGIAIKFPAEDPGR